jgi:PIN domain nuclease of toxin-antitoxin system
MSEDGRPVILDTHCWIWVKAGMLKEFTKAGLQAIERASEAGGLLVSVMSVWEIGMLDSRARIVLFSPCEVWIEQALAAPGLTLAPLT